MFLLLFQCCKHIVNLNKQFKKVLDVQKLSLLTMYILSVKKSSMLLFAPKKGPSTKSFHLFLWLILSPGEISYLQILTLPKKIKTFLQKQDYLIFSMIFDTLLCRGYLIHHKKAKRNTRGKKVILCLTLIQFLYFIHFISLLHHSLSPSFLLFAQ